MPWTTTLTIYRSWTSRQTTRSCCGTPSSSCAGLRARCVGDDQFAVRRCVVRAGASKRVLDMRIVRGGVVHGSVPAMAAPMAQAAEAMRTIT